MRLRLIATLLGVGLLALVLSGCWSLTQPLVRARKPGGVDRRVDPKRLEAHVRFLANDLEPRHYVHDNLEKAREWVHARLVDAGGRVSLQEFEAEGEKYRNVIASFGPETGERVVVGAHYDVCDELPGADDNASGVAGLVELAVLLGETNDLPLRVDLVAYTLEEPPWFRSESMGSFVHARSLAGERVRAQITLEMIGYFADGKGTQAFPSALLKPFYPDRGNFIAVIGKLGQGTLARRVKGAMKGASDLPVRSMNGPAAVPGVDFSDHRSYWAHGIPAVMVTDTAFYRNERYHTERDTPETLDYPRMAKVVEGVYQAVLALSE